MSSNKSKKNKQSQAPTAPVASEPATSGTTEPSTAPQATNVTNNADLASNTAERGSSNYDDQLFLHQEVQNVMRSMSKSAQATVIPKSQLPPEQQPAALKHPNNEDEAADVHMYQEEENDKSKNYEEAIKAAPQISKDKKKSLDAEAKQRDKERKQYHNAHKQPPQQPQKQEVNERHHYESIEWNNPNNTNKLVFTFRKAVEACQNQPYLPNAAGKRVIMYVQ